MIIYGVALLSLCYLTGVVLGDLLGQLLGVKANVGGVGIAMLLLLLVAGRTSVTLNINATTASGITFWSAMYIPIVVAMAAKQNVAAALSGGWMAILAGVAAVLVSFALVPLLSRLNRNTADMVDGDHG